LPVLVYFGLTDTFPEANARHYCFMLEGLKEVQAVLRDKGIGLAVERCSPEIGAVEYAGNASLVVCDRGYLNIQKRWREHVSKSIACPLIQVESDVIVPVEAVSPREEYSAATLRRKLQRLLPQYLNPLVQQVPAVAFTRFDFAGYDISDTSRVLAELDIDRTVKPSSLYHGGAAAAGKRLQEFIEHKLPGYAELRNDPNADALSHLSPYLHFGQISPSYIASAVGRHGGDNAAAFLEELIIRRELSLNFAYYNPRYDSFLGLPDWARQTLSAHGRDARQYLYTRAELEQAHTHDSYWNAAQREMVTTGKMHGYMRMYWGKKTLEWSAVPREAFETALYLNNKYELDGRDPNGYAGVAWCFGKHDRPWPQRPVFGSVRSMTADGLKRKFDADRYARKYVSDNP
jgi:deoxyribodipyrimidine photo-lyase